MQRNYGADYGELYKPDSMNFGGGRGNGKGFDFSAGGFSMGSSDVKLQYIDNNVESYSNIFDNAKTDVSSADKERLINLLQILSEGKNIERVVDIDEVIRYFVVHNFVCNGDSYTGMMVHNYYLYEKSVKGQLDGSIPSTLTGQKEDDSMLIDASHINISAMGTMGGNMGFGGPGERSEGEKGERPEMPEDFDMSQMPNMEFGKGMNENLGDIILFGVSILVLILGMVIVYKFKGKNE